MNRITSDSFNELDDEIKQEFYEDVLAAVNDINECAVILEAGADSEVIDRMFRSLHTVKGNCNMVFLTEFVDASHKLEDLFSEIRSGKIEYNDYYGQFAVGAINTIKNQLDSLISERSADGKVLEQLEQIVDRIQQTPAGNQLAIAEKAIIAIEDGHFNLDLVAIDQEHGRAFSFLDCTDPEFFQFISDKQAKADPDAEQFLMISETLALKLNAMLGRSIDEEQLKTGLIFVGLSRCINQQQNPLELTIEQVFFAAGLLNRMTGWSIAADVVLQLLEHHDGSGAPLGLSDENIQPAAQAMSLAIEFSLIVLANHSLGYKASLFTAVKAVNAKKDSRYKARLIERFNQVIKTDYLTNQMW